MKTDRELLELAAKAAGIELIDKIGAHFIVNDYTSHGFGTSTPWNPLENDGDALRLAAALILNVLASEACIVVEDEKGIECIEYLYGPEDYTSAWRRAIVRAAAAIGESMQ